MDKQQAKATMVELADSAKLAAGVADFTTTHGDRLFVWFDKSGNERWSVNNAKSSKAAAFNALFGGAA